MEQKIRIVLIVFFLCVQFRTTVQKLTSLTGQILTKTTSSHLWLGQHQSYLHDLSALCPTCLWQPRLQQSPCWLLDPCRWNYPAKLVCNPGAPWLQHAETPLRINSHRPGVLLMVLLKFVKSSAYFVMAFIFWVYVLMCILIDKMCM